MVTQDSKPKLFRPRIGQRGMTALHYAAYCGDLDELRRQLDAGADPNARDDYRGYTAVHWVAEMAATGGPRVEMLKLLVARGADMNRKADNGVTALSLAADAGSTTGADLVAALSS